MAGIAVGIPGILPVLCKQIHDHIADGIVQFLRCDFGDRLVQYALEIGKKCLFRIVHHVSVSSAVSDFFGVLRV